MPTLPSGVGGLSGRGGGTAWPRTDLAVEAVGAWGRRVPGLDVAEDEVDGVRVTRVRVGSPEAEAVVGKPQGTYVTLDAPGLRGRDTGVREALARVVAAELGRLLPGPEAHVFVVGLGNARATPDAVGPRVLEGILVTRHLAGQVPRDLAGRLRPVSALAPGVLGTTGIETGEIVRAVVERVRPDLVLAVDALASRSVARLARTVQIADTGIHPGAGVGNPRTALDEATVGVPVVALGVPTVVHAATIAWDTFDLLARELQEDPAYPALERLRREDPQRLAERVLEPAVGDLLVTPREIDLLLDDLAEVLASGINAALHPALTAGLRAPGG